MKGKNMKYLLFLIFLISSILVVGCVGENKNSASTTSGMHYVTEVTPFLTVTPTNIVHKTISPTTPVPEDLTCVIYSTKQSFARNKIAFSFNVKNPPIYINYSVSNYPFITRTKVVTSKDGRSEERITYKTVDLASFFEIIVRDKTTGAIYLQEGFGKDYGYHDGSVNLNKRGDLLFELSGNLITAEVKIWAKPIGNFDDLSNFEYNDCKYWR